MARWEIVNGHVDIPEGITTIGWFAFSGCTGLTSIHISKKTYEKCEETLSIYNNTIHFLGE